MGSFRFRDVGCVNNGHAPDPPGQPQPEDAVNLLVRSDQDPSTISTARAEQGLTA